MVAEASRPSRVGEGRRGRNDSVRRREPQAGVLLDAQPCEQESRRHRLGPDKTDNRLEGEQDGTGLCVVWAQASS